MKIKLYVYSLAVIIMYYVTFFSVSDGKSPRFVRKSEREEW